MSQFNAFPNGHERSDITLLGHGGSAFATESFDGAVPFDRVRDLFDFTVGYTPVYTMHNGEAVEVPNRLALVRDDRPGQTMNIVSKKYAIHQFSEVLLDNLHTLTDSTSEDLEILGAGLLSNGAVGWVQVQAPTMRIAGDDLAPTLTLASSHNGTLASVYRAGIHRFSCSNQLGAMRVGKDVKNVYKLRHCKNSRMQFSMAREALGLMFNNSVEFANEVASLIDTTVSDAQWANIMHRLLPRPTGEDIAPAAVTRWENRWDAISKLYKEDERVAPYRGTAWGAVQAFNTYRQWERPFRATGVDGEISRVGRNMADFLSGKMDGADAKIISVVRGVVGAAA